MNDLSRYGYLSVTASLVTMGLKSWAYVVTGSVSLLSDALESLVNLAAALLAVLVLGYAQKPPDAEHEFGHEKAEYFSCGAEGALILVAAVSIVVAALRRFWHPMPLEQLGLGSTLSAIATVINGLVALALIRAGRRHSSVTLEADGHHLLTDVWTSLAVLAGVGLVAVTGEPLLDPIVAGLAGLFIAYTGVRLLGTAKDGLIDRALTAQERSALEERLHHLSDRGVAYHALRTRRAGRRAFVQLHVLVPGDWDVRTGHALLEEIEESIRQTIPGARVLTHLEPLEEAVSFEDLELDRASAR